MRTVLLLVASFAYVQCLGYLEDPPGRSSAWKFGFKTPANSNHMKLDCGGTRVQHERFGGKCGVCGDSYSSSRPNEPGPGNKYASGTIVADYWEGDIIDVKIDLTTYLEGYFEFKLCDNDVPQNGNDVSVRVQQSCFDKHPLTHADGSSTKFTAMSEKSTHQVKLPDGVRCTNCVLQWRYRGGKSWGCEDSGCGAGLGPQEELWGCADVAINEDTRTTTIKTSSKSATQEGTTPKIVPTTPESTTPKIVPTTPESTTSKIVSTTPENTTPKIVSTTPKPATPKPTTSKPVTRKRVKPSRLNCRGRGVWAHLTNWCNLNCNHKPRYCPRSHCKCQ